MRKHLIKFTGSRYVLSLLMAFAPAMILAQNGARFKENRVGSDGASTVFSYFNTTPESPDGKTIAYLRCIVEPTPEKGRVPAALWVCDRDLKQHRKVADIARISVHDGAEAQWWITTGSPYSTT